jgi:hypothetical protein
MRIGESKHLLDKLHRKPPMNPLAHPK